MRTQSDPELGPRLISIWVGQQFPVARVKTGRRQHGNGCICVFGRQVSMHAVII